MRTYKVKTRSLKGLGQGLIQGLDEGLTQGLDEGFTQGLGEGAARTYMFFEGIELGPS